MRRVSDGAARPLAPRVLTVLSVRGDIVRGTQRRRVDDIASPAGRRWAHWLPLGVRAGSAGVRCGACLVRRWLRRVRARHRDGRQVNSGSATLTWARQALRDIEAVRGRSWTARRKVRAARRPRRETEPDAEPVVRSCCPGWMSRRWGGYDSRDWYELGEHHRSRVFDSERQRRPRPRHGGTAQDDRRRLGPGQPSGRVEVGGCSRMSTRLTRVDASDELTRWLGAVRSALSVS